MFSIFLNPLKTGAFSLLFLGGISFFGSFSRCIHPLFFRFFSSLFCVWRREFSFFFGLVFYARGPNTRSLFFLGRGRAIATTKTTKQEVGP